MQTVSSRCSGSASTSRLAAARSTRGRTVQVVRAMHTGRTSSPTRETSPSMRSVREKKVLNGPCVINLRAKSRIDTPVNAVAGAALHAYMQESPSLFTELQMPLGGKLRSVDTAVGLYEITIPRMQLFDMWLAPKASARLKVDANKLVIGAEDCMLTGSHHVEQLGLNDRFNVDVAITFAGHHPDPAAQGRIISDGMIEVQVDIPPPFSFMPKPVLETTGNAALAGSLSILLNTFAQLLADEYHKWAKAPGRSA
mmetsp:Transcript_22842/g.58180  ORF Transcript_22842/g.58180 Transcript_22842/m.58180 type:complete len:254 (-) Transcript_22842:475-1236(-)|eukprot:CAMPEP_0202857920 /NCGR_PEP_ID=MMETSP1391-20130828/673_1 /ASSEMBLY_ACC=CAM_ASM_000867 /TAXON_ID=1034604 /ORGANISM="Chlamydomonas leiostraca, Strain SAG 11-49" /LENGTH=253 /DNA_ID=CAMNT_0049536785 /DNA_START=58 /DNA_END=819 /DNA_ORIENTATION=+